MLQRFKNLWEWLRTLWAGREERFPFPLPRREEELFRRPGPGEPDYSDQWSEIIQRLMMRPIKGDPFKDRFKGPEKRS